MPVIWKLNPTKEWVYENLTGETIDLIYGEDGQARVLTDVLRCIFRSSEVEYAISKTSRRTHSWNYHGHNGAGRVYIGYLFRSNGQANLNAAHRAI